MPTRPLYPWTEYLRSWKLLALAAGIALLLIGALPEIAPDWDIPVSFIMALLATWFTVDGCYAIYWHFRNPAALAVMRAWNFPASLVLYGLCGVLWLYRGSLRELSNEIAGGRSGRWGA